ncbi:MAG: bifunctional DNA primase/polymerase [Alphaproteobacteria bacterium]|nr:bifunctional DNA primase/polymerase [Alphaproteobacteria bacterium]
MWTANILTPSPIPKTATVKTKKGYHLYLKYPKGHIIKSRAKIDGHDVDVRANGGYIVAPPSLHTDGGCYEFID